MMTKEQRYELFKKLPPSVQEAFLSEETVAQLKEIGKTHNLHIDKIGELGDEIGLVMLGIVKPTDFTADLTRRLEVDSTVAQAIASEVSEKIFRPIKEDLMKAREAQETPTESKETILNEIENPTPAKSVAQPHVEAIIDPHNELDAGAKYIEKKLTQPSGYKADPYREPLQ